MGKLNFYTALFAAITMLLSGFGLSGQQYLNETARWEQFTSYYQNPTSNSYCDIVYFIEGDSVINGLSYYRLMQASACRYINPNLDSLGNSIIDTTYSNTTAFSRFIRESARKFYSFDLETNSESWVYDFNITEPMPLTEAVSYVSGCSATPELLGHDTVCIGSIGRKRWNLTQGVGAIQSFIEGVGPGSGLFGATCNAFCPECGAGLIRFMLNGDTLYNGSCTIPAGFDLQTENQLPIRAIVQSGVLRFEPSDIESVAIYTTTGQLILRKNRINSATIDLEGYAPGIYIYSAATAHGTASGKIYIPAK